MPTHHSPEHDDRGRREDQVADEQADEQLKTTAEHWREGHEGTSAEGSANEVARGADRAVDQQGYGREGS